MEFNKKNIKTIMAMLFGGILFYWVLQNLGPITGRLGDIWGMLTPFIVGAVIAFIINVPMKGVERLLFGRTDKLQKLRRPISYVITVILVFGVISFAMYIIIPQLADTMVSLSKQIPPAITALQEYVDSKMASIEAIAQFAGQIEFDWKGLSASLVDMLKNGSASLINSSVDLVSGVINGLISFVIGFIFSIYVLMQKERLASQFRKIVYALVKVDKADKIMEILSLANRTFSKFLSGQCLEAVIISILFFTVMSICGFPYALLISMTIGMFSLVPMIGSFVGCFFGALLICIESPISALLFIVMFVIVQQLEGNLIYPHVVGGAVELPSIWVLFAATMGAKLGGVIYMLMAIPFCSVCYALFRTFVVKRLKEKDVPKEKLITKENK